MMTRSGGMSRNGHDSRLTAGQRRNHAIGYVESVGRTERFHRLPTSSMRRRRSNDHRAEGLLDRDVVERARSGDQDAFADLVHQVSDTLLGVARRILRDPGLAEDVLQNALLTIWRKLPHLRGADRSLAARSTAALSCE